MLCQHRSTQRKIHCGRPDEERLIEDIIELAREYGRYGYRMVTGMLNQSGWHVNHKRVERIWKQEGQATKEGPSLAQRRFVRKATT